MHTQTHKGFTQLRACIVFETERFFIISGGNKKKYEK